MYIRETQDNSDLIEKEAKIKRASEDNIIKRKLHDAYMKDEQKNVTRRGEGFCYGCNRYDHIISSLFYICTECYQKRGTEGLLSNVYLKKSEELCDICGYWKFGVWQRNVSFCDKCMRRTQEIHRKYKKIGGGALKQAPYFKKMRRKYGKDYLQNFIPPKLGI